MAQLSPPGIPRPPKPVPPPPKPWSAEVAESARQAAAQIANVQIQALGGQLAYARSICRILAWICTVQAIVIVALGALLVWRW